MSPRYARFLSTLVTGAKRTREEIDRLTGSSNGPDVPHQLRKRYGGEGLIVTELSPRVDRDGKAVRVAVYWLTQEGRAWARKLLAANSGRHGVCSLSDSDVAQLSPMPGKRLRKLFERAADEALASGNLFFDCAASVPSGGVA